MDCIRNTRPTRRMDEVRLAEAELALSHYIPLYDEVGLLD